MFHEYPLFIGEYHCNIVAYCDPFGSMRDPVLESSPDCKRATSVNIDTNVTRLQSGLETKWGR